MDALSDIAQFDQAAFATHVDPEANEEISVLVNVPAYTRKLSIHISGA
jgi:hypothetical protein